MQPRPATVPIRNGIKQHFSAFQYKTQQVGASVFLPTRNAGSKRLMLWQLCLVFEDTVWLDVNLGARELGGETHVLPFLADGKRKLKVRDQHPNSLGGGIQNE